MKRNVVLLSRKDYDRTIPWSKYTQALAVKSIRIDSLYGFRWVFKNNQDAEMFRASIGMAGDE